MEERGEITSPPSYKVIVIGDSSVGKTSIAIRICQKTFVSKMAPTIAVSHWKTNVVVDDIDVELKIWDTAGQEEFSSLVPLYTRGSQACLYVANCLDEASICHIPLWIESVRSISSDPFPFIVLNKIDLTEDLSSLIISVREKFNNTSIPLYFVSAMTGDGVEELFREVAMQIHHNFCESHEFSPLRTEEEKSSCCI